MKKNFGKQTFMYPMPVLIIATYDENGNADAMNAAWGGIHDTNQIGICISPETEELGIYKSFNYEIFERRKAIVIAFDGNSPVLNLVQEAKNGKGKSKIYVNQENQLLREKADTLEGYVVPFEMQDNIVNKIFEDNPEILSNDESSMYKKIM